MNSATIIEKLQQVVSQLKNLGDSITLVVYDKKTNLLTFRQGGNIVVASQIKEFYFPLKHRYNILSAKGLRDLVQTFSDLIFKLQTKEITELLVIPKKKGRTALLVPGEPIEGIYQGPISLAEIEYVTVTNQLLVRWFLKRYDDTSKILYEFLKQDKRLQ